ncbi:MAG: hypothetical protein Unbinned767contig1000_7 [Prokaryotic dsDNA virus sp.]|nr:MAG: hypothetical protein Unbinned767contig1000_7 [Prokaryotic dsDNA virus sp.]|tara:strand:+ start:2340 stop:2573 length:234 start_codon:yes stop_codon:yes gene_type:complete
MAPPIKTHCKWGHPLEGENLRIEAGRRVCVICKKARARRSYYKNRAKILATKRRDYAREVLKLDYQLRVLHDAQEDN